jgi:hypothetical protein
MIRKFLALAGVAALSACGDGNPFGNPQDEENIDTSPGSVYLTEEGDFLTLNNITYDPETDTLVLNNIPFDDPENVYDRITTERFNNGFDAYRSNPGSATNELEYFAVFRRSDSGETQVAAAGTDTYIDFGYGGAGAQRLGARPNLPSTGIYSYNGEYAAVRTTLASGPGNQRVEYVTGDAALAVDFDDFDNTGAVGGVITNRTLYNTDGVEIGTLGGFISLQDTDIDFDNSAIISADATEVTNTGSITGKWTGVFAGPDGNEIAGILFVEGGDVRESGAFIAEQ